MTKKPTAKNTKAEILEAYEEVSKERKTLESQLKQIQKEAKAAPVIAPVSSVVVENNHQQPVKTMNSTPVAQDTMIDTINSLVNLQLRFGSAISDLSEKLTLEAAKLQELREGVGEEIEQLEALHNLAEVDDNTLDNLIQSYEDNSKAFEEESSQRREALGQEIQDLRKAWSKEQEEYQRTLKERNDEYNKTTKRDMEEYKYDLELRRTLDGDTYEQNKNNLYKELEEAYQQQEKQWSEREKGIAEREKKFEELKTEVEAFEKKKEAEVKKAEDIGKHIASAQVKVKADMQKLEIEGQKRFYEQQIQSLEQNIQNQEARIQSLSKQLDSALKQVQDLAVKAIEGASNANSYQALKEITLEQAKGQMKAK